MGQIHTTCYYRRNVLPRIQRPYEWPIKLWTSDNHRHHDLHSAVLCRCDGSLPLYGQPPAIKVQEFLVILLPCTLNFLFIGGVLLIDLLYPSPVIHFGTIGSILIGLLFLGFIIFFSVWAKTFILPVTLLALYLPELALSQTSLDEITQIVISMTATYSIIGVYLLIILKREKGKASV